MTTHITPKIHKLTTEPWDKMFLQGAILWRPVWFSAGRKSSRVQARVEQLNFEPTEKGSFMGRLILTGNTGIYEPCISSSNSSSGGTTFGRGVILFLESLPPETWTHLVITNVSNAFHEEGKPRKGGCIFARPGDSYDLGSYLEFREELYLKLSTPESLPKIVEISSQIWPQDSREEDLRLFIDKGDLRSAEDGHYYYTHMTYNGSNT